MAEVATAFPSRAVRVGESMPRLPKAEEEPTAFPKRRRNSTNTEGNDSSGSQNSPREGNEEKTAFPGKRSPHFNENDIKSPAPSILSGENSTEQHSAFPSRKLPGPSLSQNDTKVIAARGLQQEEASAFPSRQRRQPSPSKGENTEESTAFPSKRKPHVGFAEREAQVQSREAKKRTFHTYLHNRGVFQHLNNILVEFYENVDARDHPHEYIQHYFTCLSGTDYNALTKENQELKAQIESKKRKLTELQVKLNASKAQPL